MGAGEGLLDPYMHVSSPIAAKLIEHPTPTPWTELLNPHAADTLDPIAPRCGGRPVYYRMFSGILDSTH